jgi:FtsP/CotA-like multicopper oxidase with cupredoxin domain
MNASGWSRRQVLQAGLVSIGAAAVAPLTIGASRTASRLNPLQLIPGPGPQPPGPRRLVCAPARLDLGDGVLRGVLAYDGRFPGPTLTARTGEQVILRLVNQLDMPTITHWHGLAVNFPNDGGPLLSIAPGQEYYYKFTVVQRAGLNFYHPHPHMLTGEQVCRGLAGAFIVRDAEEDALLLPAGPYEVPLVIRDASFDAAGDLAYNPTSSGFRGKFPLVNGTLAPVLAVDRGVYRFRVLNGANARVFQLALGTNAAMTIIGNDGGLLHAPATAQQITLGMGERLDLLVDFGNLGSGQSLTLRCLDANWDLVTFTGTGLPGAAYTAPAVLSTITALSGPPTPTRTFTFDGMSRINGQEYDPARLDFTVPFGVTERWRFTAGASAPHPVHVHGASFQVLSRTGGRGQLFPWEGGWKDTVLLQDRETVDVFVRFNHYRGQYVMHCHQLEHEGMGMMASFAVV